eukprot:scaffold7206_cov143-Skeletonema_marinoi.AAC.1
MVAVVVATDLWVTVDMWSAKSLIFSVSAANIATICVNFFDRYMLLNRLLCLLSFFVFACPVGIQIKE